MGLFGWIKGVIGDTSGGIEPVKLGLERNPGAVVELGAYNPPGTPLYLFRVPMRSGFGRAAAGLPVYRRPNESPHPILKEIFFCEVAGQNLEAANVHSLRDKAERALETIAPARQLPLCYFRAPRFDYSLPVYEQGAGLVCPVLTGPKLKAPDLASLRGPVTRWLRAGGYLDEREEPEVLVVRPSDLRLVPPATEIRCLDDEAIWLPAVEGVSEQGPVIGLLAHPAELETARRQQGGAAEDAPPSATDVTALLRTIGNEMARTGHLLNPWALYAGSVRPEIWLRTDEVTDPTNRALECYLEQGEALSVPIRHTAAGEVVAALEEERITVFLAGDDDALAAVVGHYLVTGGFLSHPEDLRVETARERPAEALDPDRIWTTETTSMETKEVSPS
jgi:hypothetical protein